jgi:hypothetical protein
MGDHNSENLPALIPGPDAVVSPVEWTASNEQEFVQEPPIDVIIDSRQIKERIIDYLGAVLARCWLDRSLLYQIESDLKAGVEKFLLFGVPMGNLEATLDAHHFVGRAPEQVDDFLAEVIAPILATSHAAAPTAEIRV